MIKPGKYIYGVITETGAVFRFSGKFFINWFRPHYEMTELIRQCYLIGVKSLGLISLTAFIIGVVLTMQIRPYMVNFGVASQLPAIVSIAIIREVGPVLTALVFAGKIASSIGAELASMKVTEQIDAMDVSGTNPFKYLVVTRVLATTLMLPLLCIIGDVMALSGAYFATNMNSYTSFTLYWNEVFSGLEYSDIIPAFIKTFFFGFAVGIVGCYKGFSSENGTEGVGRSANSAVVLASILIFITDLIVVQITYLFGYL